MQEQEEMMGYKPSRNDRAKDLLLWVCKALGLFALARRLTKNRLRILCYHGFVLHDEDRFRPKLFMHRETFEQRMKYIADNGYPVLTLDDGLNQVRQGKLLNNAVTITIDDGFYSVAAVAQPVLAKNNFPATLYVTTYYQLKQVPIYRLAISYLLSKAEEGMILDVGRLGIPAFQNAAPIQLTAAKKDQVYEIIQDHGEIDCNETQRQHIAGELAQQIGVDYDDVLENRILSLITDDEARHLEQAGIRLELHTHRHTLPLDEAGTKIEIETNRVILERLTARSVNHLCYPSGNWSPDHWPVLEACGVSSAVTCDAGLVTQDTNKYCLPRILDDVEVSQINFEAELSGFLEIVRGLRRKSATVAM
jgi:peptidoglycan/xylan/chitin deacetylase (PgdA/CDA1 family)